MAHICTARNNCISHALHLKGVQGRTTDFQPFINQFLHEETRECYTLHYRVRLPYIQYVKDRWLPPTTTGTAIGTKSLICSVEKSMLNILVNSRPQEQDAKLITRVYRTNKWQARGCEWEGMPSELVCLLMKSALPSVSQACLVTLQIRRRTKMADKGSQHPEA